MPFGIKPQCATCKTVTSSMWRKNEAGEVVCNSCALRISVTAETEQTKKEATNSCPFTLRKSTRAKSSKFKQQLQLKNIAPKGKGRRIIFKRGPIKAPTAVATCVTSDFVFFRGSYFQVGDIVSLVDEATEECFYGQIRGLLQDQYCEKSAVITWLIPTMSSPKGYFDPATYVLGPEEDLPRKLECMEFVCHAPSEYFKSKNSPYPTKSSTSESCFIWTRIGPQIKPLPTKEEVFGTTLSAAKKGSEK